ncbi:hypothetical protein GCM10009816_08210 [Microbacterium aquimaris]
MRHLPTSFGLERLTGISHQQEGVLHVATTRGMMLRADNPPMVAEATRPTESVHTCLAQPE